MSRAGGPAAPAPRHVPLATPMRAPQVSLVTGAATAAAPVDASSRRPRRRFRAAPWLFLAPAFFMYAAFFLWPALDLVRLSLTSWDGLGPKTFVGLENYERLLGDRIFWRAFRHNVGFLLAGLVVPVAVGLALALALSRSRMYGRVLFRTVFFLPQVLSSVTVAIIWGWIYNPSFGALNVGLEAIRANFEKRAPKFRDPA